jgi:hypothetical protein
MVDLLSESLAKFVRQKIEGSGGLQQMVFGPQPSPRDDRGERRDSALPDQFIESGFGNPKDLGRLAG